MSVRYAILFALTWTLLLVPFTMAHAQAALDYGTNLTLTFEPEHPAPGETVHISASSILLDLSDKTLVWFKGAEQIAEGPGLASVDVVAGPAGSETLIIAGVYEDGDELISESAYIRPVTIDLLWESDSYIPPYFDGRALPSAGTSLRLEARPYFVRADGAPVPTSDIIFTWRRDGYVAGDVSGRGRSRAVIASPSLFDTDTITVNARSSDGLFEASASARISSVAPRLVLYQRHPLFGVMRHRALPASTSLPDAEISLVAVPYYADTEDPNDGDLLFAWQVNKNAVPNDPESPSEITIDARGSSGAASIELAITHVTNFFLDVSRSWDLRLLSNSSAFENPFGVTP